MSANDNEKLASEGRRLLLKSLAAGGAAAAFLPDKWSKPVIDRILVPAHAQGSPGLYGIYTNNGSGRLGSNFQPGMFERLANMILPVANAGVDGLAPCNARCIALDVKTNNSVIGYVVGSIGTGIFNPGLLEITDINVKGCGGDYFLSNIKINSGGTGATGTIGPSTSNVTSVSSAGCYTSQFSLSFRPEAIPNACSYCGASPV